LKVVVLNTNHSTPLKKNLGSMIPLDLTISGIIDCWTNWLLDWGFIGLVVYWTGSLLDWWSIGLVVSWTGRLFDRWNGRLSILVYIYISLCSSSKCLLIYPCKKNPCKKKNLYKKKNPCKKKIPCKKNANIGLIHSYRVNFQTNCNNSTIFGVRILYTSKYWPPPSHFQCVAV